MGKAMRLQVVSDLHLEFDSIRPKVNTLADVLIVAGDAACISHLPNFARYIEEYEQPIVFVAGNHEFYSMFHTMEEIKQELRELERTHPHFHFLDDQVWEYEGVRFLGSTLWTDFDLFSTSLVSQVSAQRVITDFGTIRTDFGTFIKSEDMIAWNSEAKKFIKEKTETDLPCVVVTHFCPHSGCIDKQFEGNEHNAYYTCDCSSLMHAPIRLWVHGHTHCSVDFIENGVRILANPRGYYSENRRFNHKLLVQI